MQRTTHRSAWPDLVGDGQNPTRTEPGERQLQDEGALGGRHFREAEARDHGVEALLNPVDLGGRRLAIVFFAPVGWRVGGPWGLAAALVLLLVAGNVWGRGREDEG